MKTWKLILLFAILSVGCKKPYNPAVINSPRSYLVVEGAISTNDTTIIMLSRTVNLSAGTTVNPVRAAALTVESDNGSTYPVIESTTPGTYKLYSGPLDITRKYRLRIKTTDDNKEYLSDFSPVKISPPIDSIGFNLINTGLRIYANAHDATNNTRYYRYSYEETWRFTARYSSNWVSDHVSDVMPRPTDQLVYFCFTGTKSSTILLTSTAKLKNDEVYQLPIIDIPATSEKIELRYSILLRQYALSADAYKFWSLLKTNTEQLGGIFDAEPTQLVGNIHNTADPSDVVIGYIDAGSVAKKRVFIDASQLPDTWRATYPYGCSVDTEYYSHPKTGGNDVLQVLVPEIEIPLIGLVTPNSYKPYAYTASTRECADCSIRGVTKQPDFWVNK